MAAVTRLAAWGAPVTVIVAVGDGSISGSTSLTIASSGTLTGDGALSGSASLTLAASGTLTGSLALEYGPFFVQAPIYFTASGAMLLDTADVPDIPGVEYTAPDERIHFTAPDNRLHYTAPDDRLHYTAIEA